ncbi:MAG TPA: hypothetical protein VMM35_10940 [Longimicrobiales bacterium]|nr:hypothetical protein [Longimicrobiales bacterium]
MNDRASTLLEARRERLERILGRPLSEPAPGTEEAFTDEGRRYLLEEAASLYWNDLEWEHITDEEALEEGRITQLTFPGFLAFIRGLLLHEVMPDSKAPATPRPQVVEDVLRFLTGRVVELEEDLANPDGEADKLRTELDVTNHLVDLVLYELHELSEEDVERIEAGG